MNKRKLIITAAGMGFLALCVVLSGTLKKDDTPKNAGVNPALAVKAKTLSPDTVHRYIPITGRLIPEKTIELFAEVGGVATWGSKPFKEGVKFNQGEVLLRINSDEIASTLIASRSSFQSILASVIPDLKLDFPNAAPAWEKYLYDFDIEQSLPALPQVSDQKLKLFLSGRQVYTNFYNIRQNEARIGKYIIRAPFAGSITESAIDEATLVRTGQQLGEFISTGSYELEAGVSYNESRYAKPGAKFELRDVNSGDVYTAEIVRINDKVDPNTQQVKIFARVRGEGARSGVYLEGRISADFFKNAMSIPRDALVGENQVYVVTDSIATLQKIEVLQKDNKTAIISGFNAPTTIIIDRQNESLNGSKVSIVTIGS